MCVYVCVYVCVCVRVYVCVQGWGECGRARVILLARHRHMYNVLSEPYNWYLLCALCETSEHCERSRLMKGRGCKLKVYIV